MTYFTNENNEPVSIENMVPYDEDNFLDVSESRWTKILDILENISPIHEVKQNGQFVEPYFTVYIMNDHAYQKIISLNENDKIDFCDMDFMDDPHPKNSQYRIIAMLADPDDIYESDYQVLYEHPDGYGRCYHKVLPNGDPFPEGAVRRIEKKIFSKLKKTTQH